METEEDLTSLDAYTESPEIISVPSCSSSLSTSTISSQDKPEMLMSLLLQIQQFHTAETQSMYLYAWNFIFEREGPFHFAKGTFIGKP